MSLNPEEVKLLFGNEKKVNRRELETAIRLSKAKDIVVFSGVDSKGLNSVSARLKILASRSRSASIILIVED